MKGFANRWPGFAIQAKSGQVGGDGIGRCGGEAKMNAAARLFDLELAAGPVRVAEANGQGPAQSTKCSYLAGGACAKMCAPRNSGGTQAERRAGISENCEANPGALISNGCAECS